MPPPNQHPSLVRTLASYLLVGLTNAIRLKNDSGALAVRNAADTDLAIIRAADPVGSNDLVSKGYADNTYGVTGAGRWIKVGLGTDASGASNDQLPDGSVVLHALVSVVTAYDNAAQLTVGVSGEADKFGAAANFDLSTVGVYPVPQVTSQSGAAAVAYAISNTPTVGSAVLLVQYAEPQS